GDVPDEQGARGVVDPGPGALIIVDEAGVVGLGEYDRLLRHASQFDAKLLLLGDVAQLSSPSAGGGLSMLSRKNGYAQVNGAVRFVDQWQRDASVALRAGDVQALGAYDEHGALHAGSYEQMAEAASRAYVTDLLAGMDTLLTANSNEEARDLSRR